MSPLPDRRRSRAEIVTSDEYVALRDEVIAQATAARGRAARPVNTELVMLYWGIGRTIFAEQQRLCWGDDVVGLLAQDLRAKGELGRGFSRRNLFSMRRLAELWPERENVQSVIARVGWTHHIGLLDAFGSDPGLYARYVARTVEHRWSVRVIGGLRSAVLSQLGCEVWDRDREAVEQIGQRHRRAAQNGGLALNGAVDVVRVKRVDVEQEVVGVSGIHVERLACRGGEILEVERDDGAGAGCGGGGEDVAVLAGVGHHGLEAVHGVWRDGGTVEGRGHGVGQPTCLLVGGAAVGDEVAHDLIEDAVAPVGVVELRLGDAQQGVAQGQRVEDAGVEDRGERHRDSMSVRPRAGGYR